MRFLLVVSAFFLLACSGLFQKEDGGKNGSSSSSDTTTTDSTTDTVDALDPFGPCSDYGSAMPIGTTWTYDYSDDNGNTGTMVTEVTARNKADGTYELSSTGDYEYTGLDNYHFEGVSFLHCAVSGMFIDGVTTTTSYKVNGKKTTTTTETVYDPPYLALPANPSQGDSWTIEVHGTSTTDGKSTEFDSSSDCEMKKSEDVSVEAGDYTAMKEACTTNATTSFSWLAKGVGLVKTENMELVDFSQ